LAQQASRREGRLLAISLCLAALAGWVDALGLIKTGDLFVSFASGNTTHFANALAGAADRPGRPAIVLGGFLAGVIAGELLAGPPDRPRRLLVLACEAVMLTAAWICTRGGAPLLPTVALLALAMGTQNASVHEAGGVSMALTYVTGSYVKVGRGIADALAGRGAWSEVFPYAALILALGTGAFAGAIVFGALRDDAIALAAGACLLIAVWTSRLTPTSAQAENDDGNQPPI